MSSSQLDAQQVLLIFPHLHSVNSLPEQETRDEGTLLFAHLPSLTLSLDHVSCPNLTATLSFTGSQSYPVFSFQTRCMTAIEAISFTCDRQEEEEEEGKTCQRPHFSGMHMLSPELYLQKSAHNTYGALCAPKYLSTHGNLLSLRCMRIQTFDSLLLLFLNLFPVRRKDQRPVRTTMMMTMMRRTRGGRKSEKRSLFSLLFSTSSACVAS